MIDFYIPNRKNGEKIILLVRRHWFILFVRLFFWALLMLLPPILYIVFQGVFLSTLEHELLKALLVVFTGVFYLFSLLFMFNAFVDYYLDVWLVTSERIVNIEQKQIFSRVTAEHKLAKIQDITSEMHGIIPTLLNYGQVHVQTAAEKERFIFKQVPNPQEIKRKISGLSEYKKRFEKVSEEEDINEK